MRKYVWTSYQGSLPKLDKSEYTLMQCITVASIDGEELDKLADLCVGESLCIPVDPILTEKQKEKWEQGALPVLGEFTRVN